MSAGIFPGPLGPLPEPTSRGFAMFRPASEIPAPVRFALGFGQFEGYLRGEGVDPDQVAGDLSALWGFLSGHPAILESSELTEAAAIFAGNVIAVVHPTATWRVTTEPEIGTTTRSIPVRRFVQTTVAHPERREEFMQTLAAWEQDDRDEQEREQLTRQLTDPAFAVPPTPFERPPFPQRTFFDEDGQVVEYGFRWSRQDAPAEAYSRVSNPDRFAPLLLDVDALVDYLRTWYVVEATRSTAEDGVLQTRLQPASGAAMTITASTEFVQVEAGALFRLVVPDCSCDACDETAESEATRLEETMLAIAAGGLQEQYPLGRRQWLHTRLRHPDGGGSSSSGDPEPDLTPAQLAQVVDRLRELDGGWWPAWPLRPHDAQGAGRP